MGDKVNLPTNPTKIRRRPRAGEMLDVGFAQADRAAKIAVGKAYGLSYRQIAVVVGISERMVHKWVTRYRDYIEQFEAFAKGLIPQAAPDGEPIPTNKAEYKAWIEKKIYALAPRLFQNAENSMKVGLQLEVIKEAHKVAELTPQNVKIKHSGTVDHNVHVLPNPKFLDKLQAPKSMGALPPAEITEGEIVSSNG